MLYSNNSTNQPQKSIQERNTVEPIEIPLNEDFEILDNVTGIQPIPESIVSPGKQHNVLKGSLSASNQQMVQYKGESDEESLSFKSIE